jgi:hypothetical protein
LHRAHSVLTADGLSLVSSSRSFSLSARTRVFTAAQTRFLLPVFFAVAWFSPAPGRVPCFGS